MPNPHARFVVVCSCGRRWTELTSDEAHDVGREHDAGRAHVVSSLAYPMFFFRGSRT